MRQFCIHYLRRPLFPTKVLDYYFERLISVYKPKNVSLSIAKQITQRQNKTYIIPLLTFILISLLTFHCFVDIEILYSICCYQRQSVRHKHLDRSRIT